VIWRRRHANPRMAKPANAKAIARNLKSDMGCLGIVGIARPPSWPMEAPIDPASAGRATIAVVGTPSRSQPGWPVGRHVLDEPRGHASGTGQEDQRHLSANRQEHRRLDVDKSGCPAGLGAARQSPGRARHCSGTAPRQRLDHSNAYRPGRPWSADNSLSSELRSRSRVPLSRQRS
jgi:hypothetical protein